MNKVPTLTKAKMATANIGWVSERLFNANSAIFQLYHGEQVNFQWDDDEVCFVPDQHV